MIAEKVQRAWLVAKCLPRLTVVVFRYANGRWFIFRDQPDWFVQAVANEPNNEPRIENLFAQAREELALRKEVRATLDEAKGERDA